MCSHSGKPTGNKSHESILPDTTGLSQLQWRADLCLHSPDMPIHYCCTALYKAEPKHSHTLLNFAHVLWQLEQLTTCQETDIPVAKVGFAPHQGPEAKSLEVSRFPVLRLKYFGAPKI